MGGKDSSLNRKSNLCGIIYLGNFHFVARIIDKGQTVWFYDGASSEALKGKKEGKLSQTDARTLIQCGTKKASLVVYVLDKSERMNSD